ALLLPDGRVLSAGSGRTGVDQMDAELYAPPYLFKGARPTITAAPADIRYGASFTVQTPDASRITSVSLVRLGSVTHAINMDRRHGAARARRSRRRPGAGPSARVREASLRHWAIVMSVISDRRGDEMTREPVPGDGMPSRRIRLAVLTAGHAQRTRAAARRRRFAWLVLGVATVLVGSSPARAQTGLVAAYSFDEGAGTTVADASGNGNTGTI